MSQITTKPNRRLQHHSDNRDTDVNALSLRATAANPVDQSADKPSCTLGGIITRLQELNSRRARNKLELIGVYIELGQELCKLKKITSHGNWAKQRELAGFGETQALRLMQFAESWIANQILTNGQVLKGLPTDIQKLVKLIDLAPLQLEELIQASDLDEMDRKQVCDVVNAKLTTSSRQTNVEQEATPGTNVNPQPISESVLQVSANGLDDDKALFNRNSEGLSDDADVTLNTMHLQHHCVGHRRTDSAHDLAVSICVGVVKFIKKRLKASDSSLWPESISQQNDLLGEVLDALPTVFRKTQGPLSKSHA